MNISEVVKTNFQNVFTDLEAPAREQQMTAVHYIARLVNLAGCDPAEWDLFTFSKGDGTIFVNKNKLNEVFFSELEKRNAAKAQEQITEKQKEHRKRVETFLTKQFEAERLNIIANAKDNHRSCLASAENAYNSYMTYVSRAAGHYRTLVSIGDRSGNIGPELEKIFNNHFWSLENVAELDGVMTFHTKNTVMLNYTNAAAGLKFSIDMGRFRAEFTPRLGRMRVYGLENNLNTGENGRSGGFYHPHVSNNGNPCWGNAGGLFAEKCSQYAIADCMDLLASLLTSYWPEAPYASIEHFHEAQERAKTTCEGCGKFNRDCKCPECPHCGEKESDCECPTCEVCGETYNDEDGKSCGCCEYCNHTAGNCSCCGVCESTDRSSCGCCQDCGSFKDKCTCNSTSDSPF